MKKYLTAEDAEAEGYMHEANRQFFNPLGLSIESRDGTIVISDERELRLGIVPQTLEHAGSLGVLRDQELRFTRRLAELGYEIQPNEGDEEF